MRVLCSSVVCMSIALPATAFADEFDEQCVAMRTEQKVNLDFEGTVGELIEIVSRMTCRRIEFGDDLPGGKIVITAKRKKPIEVWARLSKELDAKGFSLQVDGCRYRAVSGKAKPAPFAIAGCKYGRSVD